MRALRLLYLCLPVSLGAQEATPRLSGLFQIWYTQMTRGDLRKDAVAAPLGHRYYDLAAAYTENGFTLRHAELRATGRVPGLPWAGYEVMADLALRTSTPDSANSNQPYNPSVIQDAFLAFAPLPALELRVGQFKNLQTWEGQLNAGELRFAERSQLARSFGQARDQGLAFAWAFTGPALKGRALLAVFNGSSDLSAGKGGDLNARKDLVARLEVDVATVGRLGL